MHLLSDLSCVFFDRPDIFFGNMQGGDDTGRVAGVNSRQLDMLHHRRNKGMGAVTDGVSFTFQGMIQEPVDQDRTVRCYSHGCCHISFHTFIVIYHFHAAAAKDIRRADHDRIPDPFRDGQSLIHRGRHTGLRHGDLKFIHHVTEQVPVLGQVNDRRRCTQDVNPVFLKLRRQVERRLSAKLGDYTYRFFFFVDTQYIFQGQRLEIQFV